MSARMVAGAFTPDEAGDSRKPSMCSPSFRPDPAPKRAQPAQMEPKLPKVPKTCLAILLLVPPMFISPALRAQATHASQDWAQSSNDFEPRDSLRDFLTRLRAAVLAVKERPEQAQPLRLAA